MYEANVAGALHLYRAALTRCWFPALLLALCWAATAALLERKLPVTTDPWQWLEQFQSLQLSMYLWRLSVVAGAASLLCYCAMVAVIHVVAVNGVGAPDGGIWPAVRAFPAALIATIIFLVVTSMASFVFIVPGVYLWGMWQLWLVVLVVERTGPVVALQRSWQLMAGAWWRVTTLITIATLAALLVPLIVDALFGMVAGALMNLLLAPLVPAALVAAYLDRLRARAVSG